MASGVQFLRIVSPFYFLVSCKLVSDGVLRGAGLMKEFMVATFTDLILRVGLAIGLSNGAGRDGRVVRMADRLDDRDGAVRVLLSPRAVGEAEGLTF